MKTTPTPSPAASIPRKPATKRIFLPHVWVFTLVNAGYCLPVLLSYVLEFKEGGVAETLDVSKAEIDRFGLVYLFAVLAFYFGAFIVSRLPFYSHRPRDRRSYPLWSGDAPGGLYVVTSFLCIAVIISKVLLIPTGVYSVYAFDGDLMGGGVWTISMFFSESLLIMIFAMLAANHRITSPWFYVPFIALSSNLLHGTRIFDVAAVMGTILFYAITRGFKRRQLVQVAFGLILVFVALYVAFAARTDYQYSEDATGLTVALSPVVYEAVFSQMSLIRFLELGNVSLIGHPLTFLSDAISFVTPRFINPDKDAGALIQSYADLSPLGAFSGHAAGFIYFGYSIFFVYFLLGCFGSWLQIRARQSTAMFVVYVYFAGDILFRLMRDGMIYPVKYFSNSLVVLLLAVVIFRHFSPTLFTSRRYSKAEPRADRDVSSAHVTRNLPGDEAAPDADTR